MIFQQFNQKVNKSQRRNHFLNLKSENIKTKKVSKEKEFLLLASNFTIRRVHCQYSNSQENAKSYILVRKKKMEAMANVAQFLPSEVKPVPSEDTNYYPKHSYQPGPGNKSVSNRVRTQIQNNIMSNNMNSSSTNFSKHNMQLGSIGNNNIGVINVPERKDSLDVPMVGDLYDDWKMPLLNEQEWKAPNMPVQPTHHSIQQVEPIFDKNYDYKAPSINERGGQFVDHIRNHPFVKRSSNIILGKPGIFRSMEVELNKRRSDNIDLNIEISRMPMFNYPINKTGTPILLEKKDNSASMKNLQRNISPRVRRGDRSSEENTGSNKSNKVYSNLLHSKSVKNMSPIKSPQHNSAQREKEREKSKEKEDKEKEKKMINPGKGGNRLKDIIPKNKILFYIVKPGNNMDLVKKIFQHRYYWKEASSPNTTLYHFKWQPTKHGIEYNLLNLKSSSKKVVNHFEFDPEISNKRFMFLNMIDYCDKNNINVFDFLPVTIIIKINSPTYADNIKKFMHLFKNIDKFVGKKEIKGIENNVINSSDLNQDDLYSKFFQNENYTNPYSKTVIKINETHHIGRNMWILKPPDLCGGRCIHVSDNCEEIEKHIKRSSEGIVRTSKPDDKNQNMDMDGDEEGGGGEDGDQPKYKANYILIQKYLEAPLLYKKRKFDIRMWVLISHKMEVFIFKEGHLKVASEEYTIENCNKFVHITNYSLQKHNDNFEKYEEGNEVSFKEFQAFLNENNMNVNVKDDFYPKMIEIIKLSCNSVADKLNRHDRKYSYLVLGYDFMIDVNLNVWLVEINKNTGLQESSAIINSLIPRMLDDSFRLTIDEIFEPAYINNTANNYQSPYPVDDYPNDENMWELIHKLS